MEGRATAAAGDRDCLGTRVGLLRLAKCGKGRPGGGGGARPTSTGEERPTQPSLVHWHYVALPVTGCVQAGKPLNGSAIECREGGGKEGEGEGGRAMLDGAPCEDPARLEVGLLDLVARGLPWSRRVPKLLHEALELCLGQRTAAAVIVPGCGCGCGEERTCVRAGVWVGVNEVGAAAVTAGGSVMCVS